MSENENVSNNQQPRPSSSRRRSGGGRHGGMGMMPGEKAKDFKGTLKKFLNYIGKYKVRVIFVILCAIGSTIFTIVGPKILSKATNKLFEGLMGMVTGTGTGIDFGYISGIILTLIALYVASLILSYAQGFLMSRVSTGVVYNLRKDISEKINKLPIKYFDKKTHGEVLSYVSNDIDTINQTLTQGLTQSITSVVTFLGILIMMFTINWQMTLVAVGMVLLNFIFFPIIMGKSQKYFKGQQEHLGHVNGHIEEMYGSHIIVKAFNGEEDSLKTFNEHNENLYKSAWKAQFLSGIIYPITLFIGNLGYVVITILGGYLASKGTINVGDIQAFMQYIRQFTQPIAQIANISNVFQQTMASAERVFEFLEEEEEVKETENPVSTDNIKGGIEFKNVNFGYDPEKTIIHNFSAKVEPGHKIAIVGPTGAGKTTIVKLLMRFYDVNKGEVLLDGNNIKDFTRNGLRSQFAMVLQDTWLYNTSVMENIRYGKLDASDEDVINAAKTAQVDHFVHTLPEGYNMLLNEEASNISNGQKQLLTIARAVLADPKVLILDEATSSVDTRTEILIQTAMDNVMKGRTSFIIAHRLSTIRNADIILVMNEGDIVEQGNHDELLAKNGVYANLYNSQFEVEAE
ncbi:MAG: ABC transporter ATP-binding protein/permease [Oscillospiraceae bacterium]|nr:ABC transporter ATP-binding protein/permease [Oscillospiraceae bacterium]